MRRKVSANLLEIRGRKYFFEKIKNVNSEIYLSFIACE